MPESSKNGGKQKTASRQILKPSNVMMEALENKSTMRDPTEMDLQGDGLKEHFSRWKAMAEATEGHGLNENWIAMEQAATQVIDDVHQVETQMFLNRSYDYKKKGHKQQPRVVITTYEQSAYFHRGQARIANGNLQGAIDDFTESLVMSDLLSMSPTGRRRFQSLHRRGDALVELFLSTKDPSHLKLACEDYRLALSMHQAGKQEWTVPDDDMASLIGSNLLQCLVRERLLSPSSDARPLFTVQETRDIQRELQLGAFAKERFKCEQCGSINEDLQLCGGCKQAWFCNRECQTLAWKSDCHDKSHCSHRKKMSHVVLSDAIKVVIDAVFLTDDVATVDRLDGSPAVLVRDPTVPGRYIEALTDGNAYFLPSMSDEIELPPCVTDFVETAWNEVNR